MLWARLPRPPRPLLFSSKSSPFSAPKACRWPDVRELGTASAQEQETMDRVDASLSQLRASPMLVDFEGAERPRTMPRRIRRLHERYGLHGGQSWRAVRDDYRLVVASILMSHRDTTSRAVAGLVGYGSTEALDHAFRNAGLPRPSQLPRAR
jgi:hypothetical protein